ncbi:hypothetical protein [Roseovarius dicentrarchi]|uniref:hypothetical protein n=1 Tax=Roseovarius dicentrarchi TaxID=2250573 RepID=UPI0013966B1D|nr:hypothetical protein [Roseovarius dicentrarchi]
MQLLKLPTGGWINRLDRGACPAIPETSREQRLKITHMHSAAHATGLPEMKRQISGKTASADGIASQNPCLRNDRCLT